MDTETDQHAARAVLDAVTQGLADKDPTAITAQFAPDAALFDLAPPLAHGLDAAGLRAWLDSWEGPVRQTWRDLVIVCSGELAVAHGLNQIAAVTRSGGEPAQWWQRETVCLRRRLGHWTIIHQHASVPFHMDGSFRAAIDLAPEKIR